MIRNKWDRILRVRKMILEWFNFRYDAIIYFNLISRARSINPLKFKFENKKTKLALNEKENKKEKDKNSRLNGTMTVVARFERDIHIQKEGIIVRFLARNAIALESVSLPGARACEFLHDRKIIHLRSTSDWVSTPQLPQVIQSPRVSIGLMQAECVRARACQFTEIGEPKHDIARVHLPTLDVARRIVRS